jgi:hypothetical protein
MRGEKCQILGDRALDPFVRHANITILPLGQRRLLPCDRPRVRRGREKLFHQCFTIPLDQLQVFRINDRMVSGPRVFPSSEPYKRHGRNPFALANTVSPHQPFARSDLRFSRSFAFLAVEDEVSVERASSLLRGGSGCWKSRARFGQGFSVPAGA